MTPGMNGDDRHEALLEERDFLLRSLDDLERERASGDIAEDDYRELHGHYTARAAGVLRALAEPEDDGEPSFDDADYDEGEEFAPRSRWRRAGIVVIALVLVAAMAGWTVAATFGERLPGEASSGTIELTSADQLARARQLLEQGDAVEALKAFDSVLAEDPQNPEALAYRGWLLRLAGMPDRGLEYIERAIASDPTYPDARFFRGMILYEDRKDPKAAIDDFRFFLASDPPPGMAPLVEQVLQRALADAGETAPPTTRA